MMTRRYWVNRVTRATHITSGPLSQELYDQGVEQVSEAGHKAFKAETERAKYRGWRGSAKSFHRYSDDAQ